MPILLDPGGAEASQAIFVDRGLPGQELLGRELVALAGLLKAQEPAANGCDYFGLAADDPATRIRRRQIGNRKRAAVRPNDVFNARSYKIGHTTLYATQKTNPGHISATALKNA